MHIIIKINAKMNNYVCICTYLDLVSTNTKLYKFHTKLNIMKHGVPFKYNKNHSLCIYIYKYRCIINSFFGSHGILNI